MSMQENKSEIEQIKDTIFLWIRHWYYFFIGMAICVALAVVYIKVKNPVMKVAAQVAIRQDESLTGTPSVSRNQSLLSAFGLGRSSQNIEDETLKMGSQGYIKKIVKKYALNFNYKQTEFFGLIKTELYDQPPVIMSVDEAISDTVAPVVFKIDIRKDQTFIKMKQERKTLGKYVLKSFPSVLETPLGKFTISKSEFYDLYEKPVNIKVLYTSFDYMTQIYREAIEVDFLKKTSDLIQLSMDTENPPMAKQILNEIISTYNTEWETDKDIITSKTTHFIEERLKSVYEDLLQADKSIQIF